MATPKTSAMKTSQALSTSVLHSSDQDWEQANLSVSILQSSDQDPQSDDLLITVLQSSDQDPQSDDLFITVLQSSDQDPEPTDLSASTFQASDFNLADDTAEKEECASDLADDTANLPIEPCGPCQERATNKVLEASWYCQQCDDVICTECASFHKAFKATKDHILSSLHPSCGNCAVRSWDAAANFFCNDCQQFLCDNCKSAHKLLTITENHAIIKSREKAQEQNSKGPQEAADQSKEKKIRGCHCQGKESLYQAREQFGKVSYRGTIDRSNKETRCKDLAKGKNIQIEQSTGENVENNIIKSHGQGKGCNTQNKCFQIDETTEKIDTRQDQVQKQHLHFIAQSMSRNKNSNAPNQDHFTETCTTVIQQDTTVRQYETNIEVNTKSKQQQDTKPVVPVKVPFSKRAAKIMTEFDVKVPGETEIPYIKCSAFLPDSRLLLVDWVNKKLKMFDVNYNFATDKQFSGNPWEVSVYDSSEVAVTVGHCGIIRLSVDGDAIKEKGEISPGFSCYGVSYISRNKLVVTSVDWNRDDYILFVYTTSGTQLSKLRLGQRGIPYHVTVDRRTSTAFVSASVTHTVSAIDLDTSYTLLTFMNTNTIVYTYEHKDLLRPAGMTVDKDHNLYVCGRDSHNIHQVSPQGKHIQILLSHKDGLYIPETISLTPSGDTFIVGSYNNKTVQVYKIQ